MAQILTRLIGSGQFSDGRLIARPLNPWVIWDGESTRPLAKRFNIINQALYELDNVTQAQIPPSYIPSGYVPSGMLLPVVMYPDNNYYYVEILQKGKKVLEGYWKIPYDPADDGFSWYDIKLDTELPTYPTPRYVANPIKTYVSSGAMWADIDDIIEGTIIYTADDGLYWGRINSTIIPFQGVPRHSLLYRDYDPVRTSSGEILKDRARGQDGILGSTSVPDTNDPTWDISTNALLYGADDFVRGGGVPWE